MGATLDETRVELAAQRAHVRGTADRLEGATRRAVDLKAKVRENPVKAVALVVGVAFLLLGGPRRTVRHVRHWVRGSADGERAYAGLPGSLRALVDASAPGWGEDRAMARQELALALHAWREDPQNRKRAKRLVNETLAPPSAERAFWSLVEVGAVIAAGIIARQVVARRLAEELLSSRPPAADPSPGAPARARYSGWSGQRRTTAGPAKPGVEPTRPASEAGTAQPKPAGPGAKSS